MTDAENEIAQAMTIATRAAAAMPEETAGLLIDLWNADQTGTVCPQWDLFRGQDVSVAECREQEWGELRALLEAGAFVDAAMMLAPQFDGGSHVDLHPRPGVTVARVYTDDDTDFKRLGKTPALALIAAIAASRGV